MYVCMYVVDYWDVSIAQIDSRLGLTLTLTLKVNSKYEMINCLESDFLIVSTT